MGLAEAVGGDTNLYLLVLENSKQRVMEKKQSLLKQTQKKLSDGTAINPIAIAMRVKTKVDFKQKF